MATVPDKSGNNPHVDEHIPSENEKIIEKLEEIAENTKPAE